jgi:hypothetical protein
MHPSFGASAVKVQGQGHGECSWSPAGAAPQTYPAQPTPSSHRLPEGDPCTCGWTFTVRRLRRTSVRRSPSRILGTGCWAKEQGPAWSREGDGWAAQGEQCPRAWPAPADNFSPARRSPEPLEEGAGSRRALYAWHCLRRREARPREDGDARAGRAGPAPPPGRPPASAEQRRGRGAARDIRAGPAWPAGRRTGGRYLLFGALRTRPAAFVFFLAKSPSKGSTEA